MREQLVSEGWTGQCLREDVSQAAGREARGGLEDLGESAEIQLWRCGTKKHSPG